MSCNLYSKVKTIEACERTIKNIASKRNELHESQISSMMKEKKFLLFGRFFTRQEAIEKLKQHEPFNYSKWGEVEFYGLYSEKMAKEILMVAKNCQDQVIELSRKEVVMLCWGDND